MSDDGVSKDGVSEEGESGGSAIGDVFDLREGPPLHDGLLALLPLVGMWSGAGAGTTPETGAEFRFAQAVTFAHDGRPFLIYESRTWLLDDDGNITRAAARENGFWRPGAGPDDVEVILALNTGLAVILTGTAGDARWQVESVVAESSPTAKAIDGNRRLYAVNGDELAYAQELARPGEEFRPHLNARLNRRQ